MPFFPNKSLKQMVISAACAGMVAAGVIGTPSRAWAEELAPADTFVSADSLAASNGASLLEGNGVSAEPAGDSATIAAAAPGNDNAPVKQAAISAESEYANAALDDKPYGDDTPVTQTTQPDIAAEEPNDSLVATDENQLSSDESDEGQTLSPHNAEDALSDNRAAALEELEQEASSEEPSEEDLSSPTEELPALPSNAVALASDIGEHTYLIETGVSDALVLTATSATEGAEVASVTYAKGKASTQTWRITPYEQSGWYRILLSSSTDGLALAAGSDGKLYLVTIADDATAQFWAFGDASSGGYQLMNAGLPSWCLTASTTDSGSQTRMQPVAEASAKGKRFYLIDTKPSVKAGTQNVEGAYTVTHVSSTRVVEVRGESKDNGADVWLYTSNGKKHQRVYLERDAKGYYIAWIAGTGKVLDVRGSSIIPGTNVFQWSYTGGDNQKWAALPNGDGTFRLVNKATGLVLGKGNSGYSLVGRRDDGSTAGIFKLAPVDLLTAGIYRIRPHTTTATCLDVRKASTGTAELMLYKNTGALNQRFQLVSAGDTNLWYIRTGSSGGWIAYSDGKVMQTGSSASKKSDASVWIVTFKGGWYSLINKASGKALDMRKGSTAAGTSIIAYTPNGKDSQHFTFIGASLINEGTYFLKSAYGTRLDVKGSSTKAGANVQTWSVADNDTSLSHRFRLEKQGSYFRIVNAKSGLVVTPSDLFRGYTGSAKSMIANVTQRLASDMSYQQWKPQIADGGYIFFVNVASDMALTTVGTSAGANVLQQPGSDTNKGQRWKLVSAAAADAAKTKKASTKVLMIGNSFTFYNDLPTLLVQQRSGVEAVACTRSSSYLADHASTTDSLGKKTRAAITSGGFDYVVIQAQSTEPIDDYDTYLANLTTLVRLVRQSGATPIIFGTWAFTGGSNGTEQRYGATDVRSLDKLNAELQSAFTHAANDAGVKAANGGKAVGIANVGAAFAKQKYAASLYQDNKHANKTGSTLAAQTIVAMFK